MKTLLNKIVVGLQRFCLSDWFIYFIAIFVFAGWASGLWMVFMAILFAIIAVVLLICEDTTPVLAPLFMFTMLISVKRGGYMGSPWMLSVIVLPIIALVAHTIKYKHKLKNIAPTKWKGFTLSLVLLVIPMTLGGLTRGNRIPIVILIAFAYTVIVTIFYLFFTMTADKKDNRVLNYVLKTMFAASLLVSAQLAVSYLGVLADGGKEAIIELIKYKNVHLGWASANNVAPVLAMTLTAGMYYSLKNSKISFIYLLIALAQYLLVVSTGSRGTILILTIALPFMLCYLMAKSARKLQIGLTISISFAVIVIIGGLFAKDLLSAFSEIINRGLGNNGRFELYKQALDAFSKYPVFGGGWDYRLGELYHDSYTPFWYHCTVLQILANMGILGGLFFGYFYYYRYRTFLTAITPAKLAVLVGLLIFDLYGMMDVNFFGPTFFIMMLVLTFAAESTLTDTQCRPLPMLMLEKRLNKKTATPPNSGIR